ncbi:hypothetical protein GH714_019999 [Hevea brasiliensis]|uniref:Uncharacterized protein n=1 Tax=Hevea brasiliensis TaxID=3981 RepID=A0A6A6LAD2_HEVBR|nr:hypothetical protein GH714_019999 [Hevea brasiliensis]
MNIVNLKEINLSNCENLTAIPDLSLATNLERLNFDYCTSLVEFPSSVQYLDKLVELDLSHCTSLMSLPSRINLRSLKTLKFSGCSNLQRCPEIKGNLTYLNLNGTAVEELSRSIGYLSGLVALNLKDCKQLGNLPDNVCFMKSLIIVDISGCLNVTRFPDFSENVRYLYLSDTAIEELPSSIGCLRRLSTLDLMNCKRLKNLPCTVSKLASLQKLILSGCSSITMFPEVSRNIRELYLDGTAIREIPSSIEPLSNLIELHLRNCTEFETLPSSFCKLKSLQKVNLSGCSKFENFPEILETMVSLRYLYLDRTAIRRLPLPIKNLPGLSVLELGNCKNLVKMPEFYSSLPDWNADLEYLRKLCLSGCGISHVPCTIRCFSSLEVLDLSGNNFEHLHISFENFPELQYLGLRSCKRLLSLPELPPRLTKLDANDCTSLINVSTKSTAVEGNICDFFFTNCLSLDEIACNNIMAYALLKIQIFTKRLHNQMYSVPAGPSSLCFPGRTIPKWFGHQSWKSSITIELPSYWASNDFLGFTLCALVAFDSCFDESSFQFRCSYHFKNNYGDFLDLHCDFGGWYGWKDRRFIKSDHVFVGFDPCLDIMKNNSFGKFSAVIIKFYPQDMNNSPLNCCNVIECGVRLLYDQDEKYVDFVVSPIPWSPARKKIKPLSLSQTSVDKGMLSFLNGTSHLLDDSNQETEEERYKAKRRRHDKCCSETERSRSTFKNYMETSTNDLEEEDLSPLFVLKETTKSRRMLPLPASLERLFQRTRIHSKSFETLEFRVLAFWDVHPSLWFGGQGSELGCNDSNVAEMKEIEKALHLFSPKPDLSTLAAGIFMESDSRVALSLVNNPDPAPWQLSILSLYILCPLFLLCMTLERLIAWLTCLQNRVTSALKTLLYCFDLSFIG